MTRSLLFLAISSVIFLVSCTNQIPVKEENIMGIWHVTSFKANTPEISAELLAKGKEEALSLTYQYMSGHRVRMQSIYYLDGAMGKWTVNENEQSITMESLFDGQKVSETYLITSLSPKTMQWHQRLEGIGELEFTLTRL